jgi:rod shape-determining protein MreC
VKIVNKLKYRNILFSGFITIGVLFFFIHRLFVQDSGIIERYTSCWTYPFLVLQNKILAPCKSVGIFFSNASDLRGQIITLQNENSNLRSRIIADEAVEVFAEKTKELREFEKRYDAEKAHLCQIVLHRFTQQEHAFFIDKGTQQGVAADMVAVYKNMIIGKVVHAYSHYSKVLAITDKGCKVSACCTQTKTAGIFQGCGSSEDALLLYVDRLKTIKEGDLIVSSGEGTVFPAGFGLGTVLSYIPNGVYYDVRVAPLVSVQDLNYCYVMHKSVVTSMDQTEVPFLSELHSFGPELPQKELVQKIPLDVQEETPSLLDQPTQEVLQ